MKMHFVPVLFERWETFLIVANHWDGSYHTDSVVFRWNGQQFVVFQKLPKEGAAHLKFFVINEEEYLA